MKTHKFSILISTCDKFSDLWEWHWYLFCKNWKGEMPEVYMVTDKRTDRLFDGLRIIADDGENCFPVRIKYALGQVKTPYVLLTLDDYYLTHPSDSNNITYLVEQMEKENIAYLSLYNRRKIKPGDKTSPDVIESIDLSYKYAVTLYPAIWSVEFLRNTVKEGLSPWMYEVSLTQTAKEQGAVCKFSPAQTFMILDVVRKGKILNKANRYFKKNKIEIKDRPLISRWTEMKLGVMDFISWHMPKSRGRFLKNLAKHFGMKFYSEE